MKERRRNDRVLMIMMLCGLFAVGLLALEVYDIMDVDIKPGEGADDLPGLTVLVDYAREIAVLASVVVGIAVGLKGLFSG